MGTHKPHSYLWRLALGLFLFTALAAAAGAESTLTGTVYAEAVGTTPAQPLAGVLVSDGTQVVATDAAGHYTLPLSASGALVRLSIPTGYWPAPADGRSGDRWFQRVPAGFAGVCDFALQPRVEPSTWYVAQVSDLHYLHAAKRQLRSFCAQVNALTPAPAFVMATGDLVVESNAMSSASQLKTLFEDYGHATSALQAPLFSLPGNHDMPGVKTHMSPADPLYGVRGYEALVGPAWYSFNYAGVHVVALDASLIKPGNVGAGVCPECLSWLRADLALTPVDQPLLIFWHQDPLEWKNPQDVQQILAGRQVLGIFCGHTHRLRDYQWDGFHVYEGGSLCGNLWLFRCPDGNCRGFRLLKITPEGVEAPYLRATPPDNATLGLIRRSFTSPQALGFTFRLIYNDLRGH